MWRSVSWLAAVVALAAAVGAVGTGLSACFASGGTIWRLAAVSGVLLLVAFWCGIIALITGVVSTDGA